MVLLRGLGELALAEGRQEEAWAYTTQSLELATQSDARKHMARAQLLQGEVLMGQGRYADAARIVQAAVRLAEQIRTPREVWLGQAALGKALLRLNREQEAEAYLLQATQTIEAIATNVRTLSLRHSFLSAAPVLDIYAALGHRPPPATPEK
jgi:tetratricopeptide (TPR) repeat protein